MCGGDLTSCFPSLQLSVLVFLRVVVAPLGLLSQLSAVPVLVVIVSSALRVRRPVGALLLGVGAGTDHTQTRRQPSQRLVTSSIFSKHTAALIVRQRGMQTSPNWLRTVEVGFWELHWDGVDVGMLLGDF